MSVPVRTSESQPAVDLAKFKAAVDKLVEQLRRRVQDAPTATRDELDALVARLDDPVREPAVVVVGETKKGKSSLVNALIAQPGLSPVAVDVATATYVFFRHGDPSATVFPVDNPDGEQVALDELSSWVTVDGLAANPRAKAHVGGVAIDVAKPVMVTLPAPLLERYAIIDTPGVGGLIGDHADVTRTAVRLASSMLFVTDITTPLTAPEVQFLDEVVDQVGDVVIVLNMADKLTPADKEAAMADVRRKIEDRLPRYRDCPLVAVSARRGSDAHRERSGLCDLEELLDRRIGRTMALVHECGRLRLVDDIAGTLVATLRPAPAANRTTGQVHLDQVNLASVISDMQLELSHDLTNLQSTLSSHLNGRLLALKVEVDGRVQRHCTVTELAPFVEAQLSTITEELTTLLTSGMHTAMRTALGDALLDPLFAAAVDKAVAGAAATVDLRPALAAPQVGLGPDAVFQSSIGMLSGLSIGSMLSGAVAAFHGAAGAGAGAAAAAGATGITAVFAVIPPFAIVLAGVTVGANLVIHKRRLRAGQSGSWARVRIDQVSTDLKDAVHGRIGEATYVFKTALASWSRLRAEQLREEQRVLEASSGARGRSVDVASLNAGDCERLRSEARKLLEIASGRV